jgi:hypothetical protein
MTDDIAVKLESADGLREAIGVLAAELVNLKEVQEAQGELLKAMDTRVRTLTGLLDHHHEVLTKVAGLPPRPKGDRLVN